MSNFKKVKQAEVQLNCMTSNISFTLNPPSKHKRRKINLLKANARLLDLFIDIQIEKSMLFTQQNRSIISIIIYIFI